MPIPRVYSGYVYLIGSDRFCWYKIGKCKTPHIRLRDIGVLLPFKIELIAMWKAVDHHAAETQMHDRFKAHKINGEWFSLPWEERMALLHSKPPFNGEGVFPCADTAKMDSMKFSNIDADVLEQSRKRASVRKLEKGEKGRVKFGAAWGDFWSDGELDRDSLLHKRVARLYVGMIFGSIRATKELTRMRNAGELESFPDRTRRLLA